MASSGTNRSLDTCFGTGFRSTVDDPPRIHPKEAAPSAGGRSPNAAADVDDDSWIAVVVSCVRIVICFTAMMVTTFVWTVIMMVLVPWPTARIKQGNVYGHVTGRMLMWILGNPITIEGVEFSNTRAIYICNHASPIDIFLIMWLTPTGTVGIAKKEEKSSLVISSPIDEESTFHQCGIRFPHIGQNSNRIIFYPLFGQLYVLANHIRIDRSNPTSAIESMKEAARAIVKKNLSLVIFPEGTRSQTGRLLPFKKGFVHIALQSRLPIVPIVLTGTHRAWRKGSLHVRPTPLAVKYLPPIKTDEWTADKIEDYVEMIHALYVKHLPESQRPSASGQVGHTKSLKS